MPHCSEAEILLAACKLQEAHSSCHSWQYSISHEERCCERKILQPWGRPRAWEQKALEMAEQSEVSVNPWVQQLKELLRIPQHAMDREVCKSRWVPSSRAIYTGQAPSPQVNPWLWPLVILGQVSCAET